MNLVLILISSLFFTGHSNNTSLPPKGKQKSYTWAATADSLQKAMYNTFLATDGKHFIQNKEKNTFHYWWNAHALDVLVDGYVRSKNKDYVTHMRALLEGILKQNHDSLPNEYYDDMEWLALSSLRAYNATGDISFKQATETLWKNIQGGWNANQGGGIAWRKTQLDYKNTPANAPACILAARLYQSDHKAEDLTWAKNIYTWLKGSLVDTSTGLVWDGKNRTGNGQIDKNWKFTYNQGIFIGAALELYKITGEQAYLNDAILTTNYVLNEPGFAPNGILKPEGSGDGGLFKGILIRYMALLAQEKKLPADKRTAIVQFLKRNAESLYSKGVLRPAMLIGPDWTTAPKPESTVDLSTQLSGIMLLEIAARLKL